MVTLTGAASTFDRDVVATGTTVWHRDGGLNAGRITGSGTFTNVGTLDIDAAAFAGVYCETGFVNSGTVTGAGGATFANSGSITNDGPDLNIVSGTFTNAGQIVISGAGLNLDAATNGNAGGTIRMDGGITRLNGAWTTAGLGTLQTSNGGQILFGGTLDNAGAVLDLLTSGITRFGTDSWAGS